jgi:hypothetical protein
LYLLLLCAPHRNESISPRKFAKSFANYLPVPYRYGTVVLYLRPYEVTLDLNNE